MDILSDAVRSFAPAIAAAATQQMPPAPSGAQMPQPPQIENQGEEMYMLKLYLKMLVDNAAAGKDPSLYADLVADNLTDADLTKLLGTPDVIAELGKINPKVLEHREWFGKLETELRSIVAGETPPA
jgi:hypothetical protein